MVQDQQEKKVELSDKFNRFAEPVLPGQFNSETKLNRVKQNLQQSLI